MDPALIIRALGGVIEAAIHDMPNGGSLWVKDSKEGDRAVVVVRNSGYGSWDNDLSVIFDPDGARNSLTGLGLIIARKFIEAHGGQLHIDGEQGKGTTFTISIPI